MDETGRLERLLSPVGPDTGDRPRTARDWLVDVAAVLLALGIGALALDAVEAELSEGLLAVDFLLGVGLTLTLFWRRRIPVALLLAACVAAPFSAASAGAALVLLFTVAVHRPPRVAVVLTLVSIVPLPFYYLLHPSPDGSWLDAAFGITFSAIAVAWGMFVRARRQLVLSYAERARDAEAGQQERIERARTDERARIAREMHDVLAHRISQVAMHAGALGYRDDLGADELRVGVRAIQQRAHEALDDLRGVLGVLRDESGETQTAPQPTYADLPTLVGEAEAAGVHVSLRDELADPLVPDAVGRTVYRIVQEGLTNAHKHAPGATVQIRLGGGPDDGLRLHLTNPLGFGSGTPGAGLGLVGLSERAELLGGRLEHRRERGAFVVDTWIPWPVAA